VPLAEVAPGMAARLASVQRELFADALAYREANTHEIGSFDAFATGVAEHGGFWIGAWCGDSACEAEISAKTKASIRFLPLEPRDPGAACIHCGGPGVDVATWARAY
jgi:prolyl-tRNA synthetase